MSAATRPGLFIHSLFRTGSTYLWNRLRGLSRTYCFYEPFHPQLLYLDSRESDPWGTSPSGTESIHHPPLDRGRFAEYWPLLIPGVRGVPGFHKSFSFTDFCDTGIQPRQRDYIHGLLEAAGSRVPVLQFNRSALRIAWFKKNWPDGLHVYLYRNFRNQYISGETQWEEQRQDIFQVMDLLVAGLHHDKAFFEPLNRHVHLQAFPGRTHSEEEAAYRAVLSAYSPEERYLISAYIWYTTLAENTIHADFLLNIDSLSSKKTHADAFSRLLSEYGIDGADFSNAEVSRYSPAPLENFEVLENLARRLAFSRYSTSHLESVESRIEPGTRDLLGVNLDIRDVSRLPLHEPLTESKRLEKSRKIADCLVQSLGGLDPRQENIAAPEPPGKTGFSTTRSLFNAEPVSLQSPCGGGLRAQGQAKRTAPGLPLVSVITVVRNDQEALKTTLRSVWEQGYGNMELVVVDGGSSDGTPDYLRSVQDRIDIWTSDPDEGIFDAMNKGVRLAKGDWVIFINGGDTFYLPVTVQRVMSKIPIHAELVYGHTYFLGGDFHGIVPAWPLSQLWKTMVFTHQSLFTRREYLLANPFDTRFRICADYNLIFNAYMDGRKFFNSDEPIGCFSPGFSETSRARMAWERWKIVRRRKSHLRVHVFYIRLVIRRWFSDVKRRLRGSPEPHRKSAKTTDLDGENRK